MRSALAFSCRGVRAAVRAETQMVGRDLDGSVVAEAEALLQESAPGDPLDDVAVLLEWDYERNPDGPLWLTRSGDAEV